MRRKHPKPAAAVVAKRSGECIPPAGALASDFEGWMQRNRPGLASDVADAARSAHAKRTIVIGMKVTQ
jgi:hypothetical protein